MQLTQGMATFRERCDTGVDMVVPRLLTGTLLDHPCNLFAQILARLLFALGIPGIHRLAIWSSHGVAKRHGSPSPARPTRKRISHGRLAPPTRAGPSDDLRRRNQRRADGPPNSIFYGLSNVCLLKHYIPWLKGKE